MSIDLTPTSALDLSLRGSTGSFKVGSPTGDAPLQVKYFLTHVGLNFDSGSDEKLLKELAPVREIFDFKRLDFDELMQRDIDDSRVSSELIPYILDEKTKDLIKFFPPIVVMALPILSDRNKPDDYYSNVKVGEESYERSGIKKWLVTRSGEIGSEVFQFEQPVTEQGPLSHDLVTLSFNTSKCRLVIVDGQHRAMALLALYRNLKDGWSDANRKPFESYYSEWTPDFISRFDLHDIHLPMIICTVPSLDKTYQGDYNLKKACRSIFLTLNKSARPVSRSRNLLLDDNDLISSFMRKTLSIIKNSDGDLRSGNCMGIHCVELDQKSDKLKITSPVAITGVTHFYYIIEHLLLSRSGDSDGVSARSGRFSSRTDFMEAKARLECLDELGQDVANSIRRNLFSSGVEEKLSIKFYEKYGSEMVRAFTKFKAFDAHNAAAIALKESLGSHSDVHLKPMLFDGQGMSRVFEDHREKLGTRLDQGYFNTDVPKIIEIKKQLDETSSRLNDSIRMFKKTRIEKYLEDIPKQKKENDDGDIEPKLQRICNSWFENIFSSIAFQAALICGFFDEVESYELACDPVRVDTGKEFELYLLSLDRFFVPTTFPKLKVLITLLEGRAEGDTAMNLTVVQSSPETFRNVVYWGEMQPDQWPKYKYLMLECWTPADADFKDFVTRRLADSRKQVFIALYHKIKKNYLAENSILEDNLTRPQLDYVFTTSFDAYSVFLKLLGKASSINKPDMRAALS